MWHQTLLLLHLLSAIVWLGGMFFAHFCLRPATLETLEPPKRLPLWVATLARFLPITGVAVLLLFITGLAMLLPVGFSHAPPGWHIMLALGIVMAAVFVCVYAVLFPGLRAHCLASAWPLAGQTLNRIRQLVTLNLGLGFLVLVAVVFVR